MAYRCNGPSYWIIISAHRIRSIVIIIDPPIHSPHPWYHITINNSKNNNSKNKTTRIIITSPCTFHIFFSRQKSFEFIRILSHNRPTCSLRQTNNNNNTKKNRIVSHWMSMFPYSLPSFFPSGPFSFPHTLFPAVPLSNLLAAFFFSSFVFFLLSPCSLFSLLSAPCSLLPFPFSVDRQMKSSTTMVLNS